VAVGVPKNGLSLGPGREAGGIRSMAGAFSHGTMPIWIILAPDFLAVCFDVAFTDASGERWGFSGGSEVGESASP